MNRIVKWIKKCEKITKSSSFLDIGCGNGMLLVNLVDTRTYIIDYKLIRLLFFSSRKIH